MYCTNVNLDVLNAVNMLCFRYKMSNVNRKYNEKVVCLYCEEDGSKKRCCYRKNLDSHTSAVHGETVKVRYRSQSSASILTFCKQAGEEKSAKNDSGDDDLGPPDKVQRSDKATKDAQSSATATPTSSTTNVTSASA